jgi:hypothetical protein
VPAFTAAASFNLGVAAAAGGVSASEAVFFGGAYNVIQNGPWKLIDNPLQFGNNPDNPPHIRDGADQFNQGILGVKYSENSTTGPDEQQSATNSDVDRNDHAVKSAVPVLTRVGNYIGDGLMPAAQAAPPRGTLSSSPTAPNLPRDEAQEIVSNKPARYLGRRTYSQSQGPASDTGLPTAPFLSNEVLSPDDRASFSDPFGNWTSSPEDFTPQNPNLLVPAPEPDRPSGAFSGKPMPLWTSPLPLGGLLDNSNAPGNDDRNWFTTLGGLLWDGSKSRAPVIDASVPASPIASTDHPNFSGGLLGRLAALAGIDPQNPNQLARSPPDDEREQAGMRALDARLSSSGNIKDAVALYNARKSGRR